MLIIYVWQTQNDTLVFVTSKEKRKTLEVDFMCDMCAQNC